MPRFNFTPQQLEELKRDYPNTRASDLANRFGCSIYAIRNAVHRLGLKKDPEFIRELAREKMMDPNHPGRKYWLKKGNVPPNKGRKQIEYMSAETIERTKATRFQKGQLPHNTSHDYAITVRRDKTGRVYKYIRVAQAKWVPYHRYLWEQAHGTPPYGYNVQFKDGNSLNCTLENLYLISRAEQLKNENSFYARYPEEVQQLIHLKSALNRQINKVNKKLEANGST